LAPQRVRGRRRPHPHDGTIIPDGPNRRWGTDATMAWTRTDGWVWVFCVVDCPRTPSHVGWRTASRVGRHRASRPVRLS
jgi:hypothetical protein